MALGRKTGGGSRKGSPNRATQDVRAAISKLAEANAEKVQGWLDAIAVESPEKALDLYLKMIEYHIPKLARSEQTGPEGGPIQSRVLVEFAGPTT